MKIKMLRDHTLGKKGDIVDVEYQLGAKMFNAGLAKSPTTAEQTPVATTADPRVEVFGKPPEKKPEELSFGRKRAKKWVS